MKRLFAASAVPNEVAANATGGDDWRLERLLNRLPKRVCSTVRFVRQPSARRLRIPTGALLTVGGTALVSADRWAVDASNRIGAVSR